MLKGNEGALFSLFSFKSKDNDTCDYYQSAYNSGCRRYFSQHGESHSGRQKGRQELKIGNVTGF